MAEQALSERALGLSRVLANLEVPALEFEQPADAEAQFRTVAGDRDLRFVAVIKPDGTLFSNQPGRYRRLRRAQFEWIPALHSYVIIGGPLVRGNTYGLFQVFVDGTVKPLDVPGFSTLCRPDSVFQPTKDGKDYLILTSEDSGNPCVNTPFTFIRAEIGTGNPGHGNSCSK